MTIHKSSVFFQFVFAVFVVVIGLMIPVHAQVQEPLLTNLEFAEQCRAEGWDVDFLNTGAAAGFLSDEEKNHILATNMARTNPTKYAELYVKEVMSYYQGKELIYPGEIPIMTKEGKTPVLQLYRQMLKTQPMGILFPSPGMSLAAQNHADSQIKNGKVGHGPRNASSKRLLQYGQWQISMGENISYGPQSGHRSLIALLIDDGVRSRGHRKNIFNKEYNRIGVGSAPHKKYRWSFVITYAAEYVEKEGE